jgi:hypothetical protein
LTASKNIKFYNIKGTSPADKQHAKRFTADRKTFNFIISDSPSPRSLRNTVRDKINGLNLIMGQVMGSLSSPNSEQKYSRCPNLMSGLQWTRSIIGLKKRNVIILSYGRNHDSKVVPNLIVTNLSIAERKQFLIRGWLQNFRKYEKTKTWHWLKFQMIQNKSFLARNKIQNDSGRSLKNI